MLVIPPMRAALAVPILRYMPAEDLTLPSLDLRAIARRAAVPAAAAAALVIAVVVLGGPLQAFGDAISRAVEADPRWVAGAAAFELLSFGGYIVLLWLVGARASGRLGLRESTQITLGGAAATRLLPTAGVGGAAVTLWALRRVRPRRSRCGAHPADLPRPALLGVPRLDRGHRRAAHHRGRPLAGAHGAAGGARDASACCWRSPPAALRPEDNGGRISAAAAVLGGAVRDAIGHLRAVDARLLGALVWWGFDMAVLYGMLNAFGVAPEPRGRRLRLLHRAGRQHDPDPRRRQRRPRRRAARVRRRR